VEITSSGGLPLSLTKEEFFSGVSHPRNHELMRVFLNMGLCEQLGSGMKKIMKAYRPEDYRITENFVMARFKYNEHALAVLNGSGKFGESSEKVHGNSGKFAELSNTKKRIINMICDDKTVTVDAMAASIGLTTRAIEKNIKQLKEDGIVERKNGDRGGYWEII